MSTTIVAFNTTLVAWLQLALYTQNRSCERTTVVVKVPVQIRIDESIDEQLRVFAAKNRMRLNEAAEAMIRHCLTSRHFCAKYQTTKEKAIDY